MNPSASLAEERRLTRLYRVFWAYSREDRSRVVAFMGMLVLAQLLRLAIPYLSGAAVAAMEAKGNGGLADAAWDMALIFVVCVATWLFHGPARLLERLTAIRIRQRFADVLYAKAATLPLDWHEQQHSGETIDKVQRAGAGLFGFAQGQFIYLQNAVSLIGPVAAIFVISRPTGAIAFAAYLLIFVVLFRFVRQVVRLNRAYNQGQARYAATLVDCLGNIATVLTLRLQAPTRRLLGRRLDAAFAPLRSNIVLNEAKWCITDLLNSGIRCFLAVFYVWLAWREGATVLLGSAVMVYQYAQQIGGVVSNMAGNYQELVGFQTDLECAGGLLAAKAPLSATVVVPPSWREIRVDDLSFSFPAREGRALSDLALTLRRGERIALVGESGSGKSTLLRVLAGLYPADCARFVVDGRSRPDLAHLGSVAMLAPQDPEIFEGSIGHNLTLGIDYAPDAIRRACDLAAFSPVVETLPHGLDTNIAERGLNLSGGQKQRLALARAILAAQESSLLLLDEPTSSVDSRTEARIYARLLDAMGDACIVSSLHRLHLLDRFDRIVLLEEGRIAALGTLADLFQQAPAFHELWQRYARVALAPGREDAEAATEAWRDPGGDLALPR